MLTIRSQRLKKAKQAALFKTPSKSKKKLLAASGVTPLVKQSKIKSEKKHKKSKLTLFSSSSKSLLSESSSTASNLAVPVGVGGITVPVFEPAASALPQIDASSLSALPAPSSLDAIEEQADKPPPPPKEPPVLPESFLPLDVLTKVKDLEEVYMY